MKSIEQHVRDVLQMTSTIIDTCGPRPAGSALCKKAAKILQQELSRNCDEVTLDEFKHHPRAFLGHITLNAALSIAGSVLLLLGQAYLAIAAYILGHLVNVLEFGFYQEFIDFLFKKKSGYNVVGTLEPSGEVKQQVIFSAHHDSAYEFTFLAYTPKLYFFVIIFSTTVNWLIVAALAVWTGYQELAGRPLFAYDLLRYAAVAVILIDIPFFFFLKKEATPGAGDNLVSACILLKMAELLHARRQQEGFPRHTRVIFASFDAEESGLRGSRAFARQYKKKFRNLPTYNINLESLYDLKKLNYLVSDINGTVRLSQKLAKTMQEVAKALGYSSRLVSMRHGYGATDAGELAKIGIQATTLVALNPDFGSGSVVYHTHRDDVAHLDPKMIQAAIEILSAFMVKKEKDMSLPA